MKSLNYEIKLYEGLNPIVLLKILCDSISLAPPIFIRNSYANIISNAHKLGTVAVEVEEVTFGKPKYHMGHRVRGSWVLGGLKEVHKTYH